jgi:cell division protein FtsZ
MSELRYQPNLLRIKIIGIGGAGCSTIARMANDDVRGVELIALDTNIKNLEATPAPIRIPLGKRNAHGEITYGHFTNGGSCAKESMFEIKEAITGSDVVVLVAGLGGSTGTFALPVVAKIAEQCGALVVACVTTPYSFEGRHRERVAKREMIQIGTAVKTLIYVRPDCLINLSKVNVDSCFQLADKLLCGSVQVIAALINLPGLVNVDITSVKTSLKVMGMAVMNCGYSSKQNRAEQAAKHALESAQFKMSSIGNARRVLLGISGNTNLDISEVEEVTKIIKQSFNPKTTITCGTFIDKNADHGIKVTLLCGGGLDSRYIFAPVDQRQVRDF